MQGIILRFQTPVKLTLLLFYYEEKKVQCFYTSLFLVYIIKQTVLT